MKPRQRAATILMACLAGCAGPDAQWEVDRMFQAHWANVSESDFPLPSDTPFDLDAEQRARYLKGYADAVKKMVADYKNNTLTTGDGVLFSPDARPYVEGERAGALAVIERAGLILESINLELQRRCAEFQPEVEDIEARPGPHETADR